MKGHITELVPGKKFRVFVYEGRDPVSGRKRYRTKVITGSRKTAEATLHRLAADVGEGVGRATSNVTFADLVERWFTMMSPDWSPSTVLETRRVINTKLKALGKVRLDKITPAYLDQFYAGLRSAGGVGGRPLAPATVRRIHVVVRAALEQGVRWNWIVHNPAQRAYTGRVQTPHNRVPDAMAVATLLEKAWTVDPDLAALLTLEAYCGNRRSELLALRWSDFDEATATISVSRAVVLGPDGVVEKPTTKTGRERHIALAPESVTLLVEHRRRCAERAEAAGGKVGARSYIFSPEIDGSKPWWPSSVSRSLSTLCRSAGIEPINLRELRRFVASTMVAGGVDMTTETAMLGHGATVALTHYTRSDRAAQERASRIVADAVAAASTDGVTPSRRRSASSPAPA